MRKRLAVSAFLDNESIPRASSWGLCPQTPGVYRFTRLPVALEKSKEAAKMLTASNRLALPFTPKLGLDKGFYAV